MGHNTRNEPRREFDLSAPAWLTPRVDAAISAALVYLSIAAGGLGFYFIATGRWQSSPLVLIGLILWGVSCVGIRDLLKRNHKH